MSKPKKSIHFIPDRCAKGKHENVILIFVESFQLRNALSHAKIWNEKKKQL